MASDASGTRRPVRRRFWLETGLTVVSVVLFLLTLAWHDWIEAFGIEPDGGDGSLEWVLVAVFAVAAAVSASFARREWRRPRAVEA